MHIHQARKNNHTDTCHCFCVFRCECQCLYEGHYVTSRIYTGAEYTLKVRAYQGPVTEREDYDSGNVNIETSETSSKLAHLKVIADKVL